MATSTTLSCNRTDNTYTGILAQGNCSGTVQNPTRIVTNSFGVHHWALNYTGSLLLTDEQIRANNTWDAQFYPAISTNRFAARHQGVPSSWGGDLPGVFKVDRGTAELPPNFAPFQAGVTNLQWFRNEPNGAKQICARPNNYTCISPFSLTAPTGSSLTEKEALAIGAVQTAEYPNEMLKWAQRSLYKETKEDSTLLANSAILTNFKDSLAQTAEGVRYEVSEKEQDAFTLDATAQMVLSSDQIYLDSLEQAIMALDTLAAINNDSLAAVQKEALFANLEQQDIVYKATLQSYEQAKLLKVALAKNENAATTSMEQYEQNDKEITDIFLNTIAVNNTDFSGSEATTLQSIAAQCPLIGGPAVYRARAIYEKIQHIEYNDVATCLSQGISYRKPKPTANISATNQFSLRPNPANDFVTINSIELITEPIKVEIVDLLGKTVTLANLLAGQKSVDIPTSSLTAGVYTCRLSNGIALKLVIVH
jgi:hypothetical protein